jgi:cephalosporin hydroxylase
MVDPKDSELIRKMAADPDVAATAKHLFALSFKYRYSYNFRWLGRPVIQYPQDLLAIQELLWEIKPDVVVETGIAHGGSLIFHASILELIGGSGKVVGVDVEIRPHNRVAIEQHRMASRITLIEGSSLDPAIVAKVHALCQGAKKVMVLLDSNHTHDHVLQELRLYSSLVTKGSYLVVLDTMIEDMPAESFPDRPWGPGNNPKSAVREFLASNPRFVIEEEIENKLLLTVAPSGYLRCVAD